MHTRHASCIWHVSAMCIQLPCRRVEDSVLYLVMNFHLLHTPPNCLAEREQRCHTTCNPFQICTLAHVLAWLVHVQNGCTSPPVSSSPLTSGGLQACALQRKGGLLLLWCAADGGLQPGVASGSLLSKRTRGCREVCCTGRPSMELVGDLSKRMCGACKPCRVVGECMQV